MKTYAIIDFHYRCRFFKCADSLKRYIKDYVKVLKHTKLLTNLDDIDNMSSGDCLGVDIEYQPSFINNNVCGRLFDLFCFDSNTEVEKLYAYLDKLSGRFFTFSTVAQCVKFAKEIPAEFFGRNDFQTVVDFERLKNLNPGKMLIVRKKQKSDSDFNSKSWMPPKGFQIGRFYCGEVVE